MLAADMSEVPVSSLNILTGGHELLHKMGRGSGVSVFGGLRISRSRIGRSCDMQDELYFKHLGRKLNCSYTKNKL